MKQRSSFTAPGAPTLPSHVAAGAQGVVVRGARIYLADGDGGLAILGLTPPGWQRVFLPLGLRLHR